MLTSRLVNKGFIVWDKRPKQDKVSLRDKARITSGQDSFFSSPSSFSADDYSLHSAFQQAYASDYPDSPFFPERYFSSHAGSAPVSINVPVKCFSLKSITLAVATAWFQGVKVFL